MESSSAQVRGQLSEPRALRWMVSRGDQVRDLMRGLGGKGERDCRVGDWDCDWERWGGRSVMESMSGAKVCVLIAPQKPSFSSLLRREVPKRTTMRSRLGMTNSV